MEIFKNRLKKKTWADITIAKHREIMQIYDKYRMEDDIDMLPYELVCAVYGMPWEWMASMQITDANRYVESIAFLGNKPKPKAVRKRYELNGKTYVLSMNPQELNTAQYIDFQQMAEHSAEMPAQFLAIILVPEGKSYNDGYLLDDAVSDIDNFLSVEEALGITAFFLNLWSVSTRLLIRRLTKLEKQARKEGLMTTEQLDALRRIREIASANGSKRLML